MSSFHITPSGTKKPVKNLGWLLKNWKKVESFTVTAAPKGSNADAHMVAHLRDGGMYVSDWADRGVMRDWLRRPAFRGIRLVWFGEDTKA